MRAPPTRKAPGDAMKNTFIGSPIERLEDLRFLRGSGTYVDDLELAGLLHAVDPAQLGRARAHRSIDASAALALPGVHAVITAKDMPEARADHSDAAAAAAASSSRSSSR